MTDHPPIVFIVDDDASVREALKNLIRSVGLHVELFGSATEFLETQRPDAPSCLVLDVRLPGISGLDLQRRLADANVHIPIIIITGHGDIPMSVRAMKAGAIEFLTKPFRDQDLLDAIQVALERNRTRVNGMLKSRCSASASNRLAHANGMLSPKLSPGCLTNR
jgi:FixJ family two-component response regulator